MAKLSPMDTNILANVERQRRNRKSAVRCLFGPPDRSLNHAEFVQFQREQVEEAKLRWNFDFIVGKPVEGPYNWERLSGCNQHEKPNLQIRSLIHPAATPTKPVFNERLGGNMTVTSPKYSVQFDFTVAPKPQPPRCPTVSAEDEENRDLVTTETTERRGLKRKRSSQITDYFQRVTKKAHLCPSVPKKPLE